MNYGQTLRVIIRQLINTVYEANIIENQKQADNFKNDINLKIEGIKMLIEQTIMSIRNKYYKSKEDLHNLKFLEETLEFILINF